MVTAGMLCKIYFILKFSLKLKSIMMIDPRKIGFDIDGVLADTMQLFIDILWDSFGINHISLADMTQYDLSECLDIEPEIISSVNQLIIDGNYSRSLKPIEGAAGVLRRLSAFGPIRLVTARPYPGPIADWIKELLPSEYHSVEITATGDFEGKLDILKSEDITYFVEDRLDTCFLLQGHDITPVLFVQPWNRQPHPFEEVNNWQQLEKLIEWH